MRRKRTMSLSEVISVYKREMNIDDQLKHVEIVNSWGEIAGTAIASRTTKIYIRERALYIHLSSSVVRNELLMMKEIIKSRVNEKAGMELVIDIVLK